MKYREVTSYANRGETGEVIFRVTLTDGVIGYDGVPADQIEIWESDGLQLGQRRFKPQEDPEGFLRWLHLEDSSYSKASPIYDDGEE